MPDTWSETEKRTVLHLGLTYLLTSEGIPSLYYGVEQEFSGGNDPANRETFWNPVFYEREVSGSDGWLSESKRYDSNDDGEPDTLWQPFDTGNPTFLMLKELIAVRHAHVSLRRGSMIPRWSTRASGGTDHGIFAFERQHPDETALVILNLASGRASTTSMAESTMPVSFAPGTALVDALDSGSSWTVSATGCTAPQGGGCVDVIIPPRSARILLTQ
jgi:glycosidase